jgi:hypothetical protein
MLNYLTKKKPITAKNFMASIEFTYQIFSPRQQIRIFML